MTAAYSLAEKNDVTVIERENFTGGQASVYHIQWDGSEYSIMKTYHHVLDGDKTTIRFIKILGLQDKFFKKNIRQGFIYKGILHGFSTPIEMLKFPIPLIDKIRLAKFILYDVNRADWDKLKNVSAKDWVVNSAGKLNYDIFFSKLARNKFQIPGEKLSANWLGTRFVKESKSIRKAFGGLRGGFGQISEGIIAEAVKRGTKIISGADVLEIQTKNKKSITYTKGGKKHTIEADAIVSTIAPKIFLKLADKIGPTIKKKFNNVEYVGCVVACVGVNIKPSKMYWINVLDDNMPFSVMFNHTALYDDAAPPGKSVYYIGRYMPITDELWKLSDSEILEKFISAVDKIIPGFASKVEWKKIVRFANAEVIYYPDFENPPIKDGNGLYFAGVYKIYPKIRNTASAIEEGLEVAEEIKKDAEESRL